MQRNTLEELLDPPISWPHFYPSKPPQFLADDALLIVWRLLLGFCFAHC